jgi:hypothetical protein
MFQLIGFLIVVYFLFRAIESGDASGFILNIIKGIIGLWLLAVVLLIVFAWAVLSH